MSASTSLKTLVISPLVSLMDDQIAALVEEGVRAVALHSNRPDKELREDTQRFVRGRRNPCLCVAGETRKLDGRVPSPRVGWRLTKRT
ncbi:MAG: hypothetical protein KatS3mg082_1453 [Nitrospiraceae bacterium]|nr:MAG: hypothetical protein KatS3mg082_1453 [Nitrospiraceae bacterium]